MGIVVVIVIVMVMVRIRVMKKDFAYLCSQMSQLLIKSEINGKPTNMYTQSHGFNYGKDKS